MGGTVADLMITLGDSINAYNSLAKGKIQANLTTDVVVVEETPRGDFKGQEGIDKLEKEFDFKPTFTLLHLDMDLQGADDGQLTNVIIKGFAKYKSDDKNGILQFTFEAEFQEAENKWLFQKVSASSLHPAAVRPAHRASRY